MSSSRTQHSDMLAAGQRIGPFVLLAPLGSGGSGRIWAVARVGQLGFSKRMVLKVMRQDKLSNDRARERFDREACLGARLSHPNVRAVHDLGSHEGRPFMALSWVDASLEELLEHVPGHALDWSVAAWIGMQCCSALSAAHEYVDHAGVARPIVHRDVSPGNILLTMDGHALLADLTAPAAESSPRPGTSARFFGSLGYAAPEALRQQSCDARADLFSLGAVLFEALAGAPAFSGDDERGVIFQILEGGSVDLAQRAPRVPADLVAVVERCLERRVENRFQSARELRDALSRCSGLHSPFTLEQRTAGVMRDVLGARVRAREEALYLAYQRIAPSSLERTETLPIRGSPIASASERVSEVPADLSHDPSRAGAAISKPRPQRRRRTLWAAAVLSVLLGLYGSLANQGRSRGPVSASAEGQADRVAGGRPANTSAASLALAPAPTLGVPPPTSRAVPDAGLDSSSSPPEPVLRPRLPASPRATSRRERATASEGALSNRFRPRLPPTSRNADPSAGGAGRDPPNARIPLALDRESPYVRRKRTAPEGATAGTP